MDIKAAFAKMSTQQKVVLIGGGGLVAFLLGRTIYNKVTGNSTASTTSTAATGFTSAPVVSGTSAGTSSGIDPSTLQQMFGAVSDQLNQQQQANQAQVQALQQANQAQLQSLQQMFAGVTDKFSQQQQADAGQFQALQGQIQQYQSQTTQNIQGLLSQMSTQNQYQAVAKPVSTYQPITLQNATPQTVIQTSIANPGSMVKSVSQSGAVVSSSIEKAGSNGQLHQASTYNQAVNEAGGQWLNHQFYAGSYNNQGQFVAKNASTQAAYNRVVPSNHVTQQTSVKSAVVLGGGGKMLRA